MELDLKVNGSTSLAGLIGHPVPHTVSPQLHNTISTVLKINQIYLPFDVEPNSLEQAVTGLKSLGFKGFNITIPHKHDVIRYLDSVSEVALLMGAVNTVRISDGILTGYNTDGDGFARAFTEETGKNIQGSKTAILGAGGTARSLAVKAALEGAEIIYLINRTLSNAKEISDIINTRTNGHAESVSSADSKCNEILRTCDIIINTTSLGMHPVTDQSPVDPDFTFRSDQVVYDVIYNPQITRFLHQAQKDGCITANGLGMLFYQGVFAYQIWNDIIIPEDVLIQVKSAFTGIYSSHK